MRRTLLSSVAALALAAPGLAAGAVSAAEQTSQTTATGIVTTVTQDRGEPRAADDTDQVLLTRRGLIDLTERSDVPMDRRVTVELADAPGDQMRVVDVLRVGPTVDTLSAAAAGTAPEVRKVYVGIVTPLGWTAEENTNTEASVTAMVDRVSDYWASQTNGEVRFEVADTVEFESAYPCGETYKMWNEALPLFGTDENGDYNAYGIDKHLLLVAPNNASVVDECPYGLGTVGALHTAGNAALVSDNNQSVFAHELGHNLGLQHSNSLSCATAQDAVITQPMPAACTTTPYDDLLDVMGFSGKGYGEGNLNVAHVDDLGIMANTIASVPVNTTVTTTIAPLSDMAAGTRGLKITDETGQTYFADYRTDSGRDHVATVNRWHPRLGVELLREDPSVTAGSYLLDATPSTAKFDYDRALPVGATFTNVSGTITVKVLAQNATGATLAIGNGVPLTEEPTPEPQPAPLAAHLAFASQQKVYPDRVNHVAVEATTPSGKGVPQVRLTACVTDLGSHRRSCSHPVTDDSGLATFLVRRPEHALSIQVTEDDPAVTADGVARLFKVVTVLRARTVGGKITATVLPRATTQTLLQRQQGQRWVTAGRKPTSPTGTVSYNGLRSGRYRLVVPATGQETGASVVAPKVRR